MSPVSERQALFLEEMGIGPLWSSRAAPASVPAPPQPGRDTAPQPARETAPPRPAGDTAPPQAGEPAQAAAPAAMSAPGADEVAAMDAPQLKAAVAGCTKCGLCRTRTRTVYGTGDERAQWLFVGEGPGRNEDLQGEPFVGPAGKLLDNMLRAIGLQRGANAYIANIVKCRPTDANGRDRPPAPQESAACLPYLQRQIELIRPAIIVALGKTAAVTLLGADPGVAVSELRGKVHRYAGRPLIVTYHPAYLLRSLTDKRKAWADLCLATSTYAGLADPSAS